MYMHVCVCVSRCDWVCVYVYVKIMRVIPP